jgi:hypothetical protein
MKKLARLGQPLRQLAVVFRGSVVLAAIVAGCAD